MGNYDAKEHATRIIAAAIRLTNGSIITRPPPARHPTLILDAGNQIGIEQGFLTSEGDFVGRELAYEIAHVNGQCIWKEDRILYSEDLW